MALVTGASSGVGYAFATQFARRGYDLVVADSCDDIHTAADALSGLGTNVRPIQVDARLAERPDVLYRRVLAARQPVVAAALNSPVDRYDLDDSLEDVLQEMVAGIGQTMRLARLLAEGMVVHGRGGIILTCRRPEPHRTTRTTMWPCTGPPRLFSETSPRRCKTSWARPGCGLPLCCRNRSVPAVPGCAARWPGWMWRSTTSASWPAPRGIRASWRNWRAG